MKEMEKKESSVRALDKAINILEAMSRLDRDIDLASLARIMQMPKSTLLRLLTTMKTHNLIRQDESTKRFSLGLGLVALGRSAEKNFDLVDKVHPYLIELAEKTGETASLMTLEGDHGIYADQVLSKSMIRGQPRVGMRLDLYCSSAGKILLSAMEDARIDALFRNRELVKMTGKTVDSFDKLKKEVQKVS